MGTNNMMEDVTIEDLEYTISELHKLAKKEEPLATILNEILIRVLSDIMEAKKDKTLSKGDLTVCIAKYIDDFHENLDLFAHYHVAKFFYSPLSGGMKKIANTFQNLNPKHRLLIDKLLTTRYSKERLAERFHGETFMILIQNNKIEEESASKVKERCKKMHNNLLISMIIYFRNITGKFLTPEKLKAIVFILSKSPIAPVVK